MGTLEPDWVEAMILAGKKGRERGIPVVLDPVGAGATAYRTAVGHRLLKEVGPSVVRGNAGEIGTLAGAGGEVRGVDSLGGLENPGEVAREAAGRWDCVVTITGKRDWIADAERLVAVDNGHAWLTAITGTGCMSTAVVGAFAAVEQDRLVATVSALGCYGLAAELAAERAAGPGSFKCALFDALFNLTPERVSENLRLSEPGSAD
jgi:hydroxyethylthiazole kinase